MIELFDYKYIHLQNTHVHHQKKKRPLADLQIIYYVTLLPLFYSYLKNLSGFLGTMTGTSLFLCLLLYFSDLEPLGLNISVTICFYHPRVSHTSRFKEWCHWLSQ